VRNHRFFVLPLLLAMAVCLAACSAFAETWYVENEWNFMDTAMDISGGIPEEATGQLAKIERSGVLRVAIVEDQLAETDLALARKIAEKMGVELKIITLDATQMLPSLTEDQSDLAISAISFTPARALSYTMSAAYFYPEEEKDIGILIPEGAEITSTEDLEGKTIVAQSNSLQEAFAAKKMGKYREFRRVSTARAVYEVMEEKKADAGIVSIHTAEAYLRENPDCGLCLAEGLAFAPEQQYLGYRVAAKKGETQLAAFVNGVIAEAAENGKTEK